MAGDDRPPGSASAAERTRLVTFLGKGDYRPTVYEWGDRRCGPCAFVARALAELAAADEAVVLATAAARAKNGAGLERALAEARAPAPAYRELPPGNAPEDLWAQFEAVREAVDGAPGRVLFDTTHSFRAHPFFAAAVLAYQNALGAAPGGLTVVYGEFREEGVSPIWDLAPFTELVDWAHSIGTFLRTGHAGAAVALAAREESRVRRSIARGSTTRPGRWPRLKPVVDAMRAFADDLATVRIASLITGLDEAGGQRRQPSSAARLFRAIDESRADVEAHIPALAPVLGRLAAQAADLPAGTLLGESGHASLAALARLYLRFERYPEAAIVVREAEITRHAQDERAARPGPRLDPEARRRAEACWRAQDPDRARTVAEIRNDIQHGGFNRQPLAGRTLEERVKRLVEQLATASAPAEPSDGPSRRIWLVSRHPGAEEWVRGQGIAIDGVAASLELASVEGGDVVIGSLPAHVAAEICARGAEYWHLRIDRPPALRGVDLTARQMSELGARIERYRVERAD